MSFIDTIIQKIENLGTLEIRTVIGKFKWDQAKSAIDYQEGEVKVIMTQINLVGGDSGRWCFSGGIATIP